MQKGEKPKSIEEGVQPNGRGKIQKEKVRSERD